MSAIPFHLASASARRLDLLRQIGVDPRVRPSGAEENELPGESRAAHVRRLAETKARRVARELEGSGPGVVLGADTAVVIEGSILGKPVDADDARRMLRMLRGRAHEVLTGVFVLNLETGRGAGAGESTRVWFRDYDDGTIDAYVRGGEPMDKAGAYGIQGAGALLSRRIEGSWSNVVGLPLERIPELLTEIGVDLHRVVAWGGTDGSP